MRSKCTYVNRRSARYRHQDVLERKEETVRSHINLRVAVIATVLAMSMTPGARADSNGGSDLGLPTITVVATGVSNMNAASAGDVSQDQMQNQRQNAARAVSSQVWLKV